MAGTRSGSQDYTAISLDSRNNSITPDSLALPTSTASRTPTPARTHIRRRSSGFATPDVTIHLSDDLGESYFREKRTGSGYSKLSAEDGAGEEEPLTGGGGTGSGYITWRDGSAARGLAGVGATRKKGVRRCLIAMVLLGVGIVGWLGGLATSEVTVGRKVGTGANKMVNKEKVSESRICNPYEQYGVLNVNTSVPTENMWQPIAATEDCQPVNFVELLRRAQTEAAGDVPELDFLRNRTIVIFGDSVDRDHNEHFCSFVGGWYEMISDTHELSPPYPPGKEIPPEGYQNFFTGERVWPNYHQSRPFICHVDKLNFRVLNIFHYGFRGETDFIVGHPHFYPPATVEDRFDHIVVPLMQAVANKFSTSPVPDILSIAPGFWGLLRQSSEDQRLAQESIQAGQDAQETLNKHNVWRTMSVEKRRWNERRITEILRHLAKGWKGVKDATGRRTPLILWRALHFIKETDKIPYNRLIALDQVGRSVVDRLVAEGRAAEEGSKSWKAWTKSVGAKYLGFGRGEEGENEALEGRLGSRLKIDEWGSLMLTLIRPLFGHLTTLSSSRRGKIADQVSAARAESVSGGETSNMDTDASSLPKQAVPAADEVTGKIGVGEDGVVEASAGAVASVAAETGQVVDGVSGAARGAEDVVMAHASPSTTLDGPFTSFSAANNFGSAPSGLYGVQAVIGAEKSPLSTPEPSFPTAAQPHRPRTPPRNSSFSTAGPSSSASSADTLIAGTQQTTLDPSGRSACSHSLATQLTQTELADDDDEHESPDPLRIQPVPSSAASSVARPTASFRARSVSREPSLGPPLQSSPIRPARQRSKTPSGSAEAAVGENVDPASLAGKGKGRRAVSGPLNGAAGGAAAMAAVAEDDDDELMMPFIPSGPVKPFGNGGVALSRSSSAGATAGSAGASAGRVVKAEASGDEAASLAMQGKRGSRIGKTEKKKRVQEHSFELVVEHRRSPSLTRKHRTSKSASRTSSPQIAADNSPRQTPIASTSAAPETDSPDSTPLASVPAFNSGPSRPAVSRTPPDKNNTAGPPPTTARAAPPTVSETCPVPTSPLSSLPPSSAPQESDDTGSTSPARHAKRNRPSRRDGSGACSASEPDDLTSDPTMLGESNASSSTAANPSPKKKAKRPPKRKAPLVKKNMAERRRSSRGAAAENKEEENEPDPMEVDDEAAAVVEEKVATPVKGKKGRVPKAAASGGTKWKGKGKETETEKEEEEDEAVVEAETPAAPSSSVAQKEDAAPPKKALLRERRRSTVPVSMKEASSSSASETEGKEGEESGEGETEESSESEDDDAAEYTEPQRKQKKATGRVLDGEAKRAAAKEAAKAKATVTSKKTTKDARRKGNAASQADSQDPPSSPTRFGLRPSSSFASQLFGTETAAVETPEQRAKGWSLHSLPTGKPIWAHVRKEEGGFWWPGEIVGNLWDKPLRVQLYLENEADSSLLMFTDKVLSLDGPTSEDVVTFRNPIKLRFDKRTFRNSPTASAPSDEVFAAVLDLAKEKDAEEVDGENSDGGLPPPSSLGAPRPGGSQRQPVPFVERNDSEEDLAEEAESEDELLRNDETAGLELPAVCIAKYKNRWWAAQALGYEAPSPVKKGAKAPRTQPRGKFKVQWTDLTLSNVTRKQILFPMDKAFFQVPLGETQHELPTGYFQKLATFLSESLPPELRRIINENYSPVTALLDDFFAGGHRRSRLAKKAVYGEYTEKVVENIREAVVTWAKTGDDGARPKGSERYEALTDNERTSFCADVLLATAVVLNQLDDAEVVEEIEAELKEAGEDLAPERVEELSFQRGREQLECRSITKAVEAIRNSKSIVAKSRAQRRKEES
ncbi:hypothetical protein JCM11251_002334 [Rhodosporidiobolus azoricus]